MAILSLIICILLFSYFFYRKKWYHPAVLMMAYWTGLIFFASLRLFGLYKISDWGYLIFIIGLVGFCAGTSVGEIFARRVTEKKNKVCVIDYRVIYILYFVVIIFLLYNFANILELLQSGYTWAKIRRLYSNQGETNGYNEVLMSSLNVMINQFISTPTVYASLPIAVADMLIGKQDKKLFFMTLVMTILWMTTSGGRSVVVWLVLYCVLGLFIIRGGHIKIPPNIKKIIRYSLIPLIIVFVFITIQRKGENMDLLKEIYIYFPVGLKNFDYHMQQFEYSNHPFFLGASSLYGFIYPIIFFLKQFGILDYPTWLLDSRYYSFTILEPNSYIGINMNAYATIMYQPYLDGGIIGVLIFLFLFGSLCGYYFRRMDQGSIQIQYLVIYLFLAQKIIFSQVRFYFTQTQQAIAFIIIMVVFINARSVRNRIHISIGGKKI